MNGKNHFSVITLIKRNCVLESDAHHIAYVHGCMVNGSI